MVAAYEARRVFGVCVHPGLFSAVAIDKQWISNGSIRQGLAPSGTDTGEQPAMSSLHGPTPPHPNLAGFGMTARACFRLTPAFPGGAAADTSGRFALRLAAPFRRNPGTTPADFFMISFSPTAYDLDR